MKKLFTVAILSLITLSGKCQITYDGYTFNSINIDTIFGDSIQIYTTVNAMAGSTPATLACYFRAAKSKTWFEIEAIMEDESLQCFIDGF